MVDYRDGVAIGEIIVYIPLMFIAVFLAISHGFRRNSGWIYLIIFTLARVIGPIFQLRTIHDPTNTDLYTGAAILQSIGLSPLTLAALGLLSRVISSINKMHPTFPTTRQLKVVQLITTVGLILGIVGGINASNTLKSTGKFVPQASNKVSVSLFIVAYILLFVSTILTSFTVSNAKPGEKRLLFAVALSLPFLLVRLVYACLANFDPHSTTFNQVSGNVTVLLVMALIMELIVVIIYEIVGLTLGKLESYERHDTVVGSPPMPANEPHTQGQPIYGTSFVPQGQQPTYGAGQDGAGQPAYGGGARSNGSSILETLGRRTIIGRIIKRAMNAGSNDDVEMQRQQQQQPAYGWR